MTEEYARERGVVTRIFQLYDDGRNSAQIAELLDREKKWSNKTWFRPPTWVVHGTASGNKED